MAEHPMRRDLTPEITRLMDVAREWNRLFPQASLQGDHWLRVLTQAREHAAEDLTRLAVVGTVKSGKSTLINALVGRDALKRGAGILTAMVTRVQPGPEPRAVLRFKDWSDIHSEIHRALGFFPNSRLAERPAPLDLRQPDDRRFLAQLLEEAQAGDLWSGDLLNQDYLILKSYLEGYDLLAPYLEGGDPLIMAGTEMGRHRELVTREETAVFLRDALLTLPMPWLPPGVELGDCQGSDSPFPQHLTRVLAYLGKCDLLLYVISSRVGLRQADFQFLGELNRLGLGPHLIFVFNLDLGEHRGLEELRRLRDRVMQELRPLLPEPSIYAFSALKLLLERRRFQGEKLDPREEALLSIWRDDSASDAFSGEESRRFDSDLAAVLHRLQEERLWGGSFSQVRMVARGLTEHLDLARRALGQDLSAFQDLEARLSQRRRPLTNTLQSLRQTLAGARLSFQRTLKERVGAYLDPQYGLGEGLLGFIRRYEPDWDQLCPPDLELPFRTGLYRLFQGFHKDFLHFVNADLNVQVLQFIREQEAWLKAELTQTWSPLFLSVTEALGLYYREIGELGVQVAVPALQPIAPSRPADLDPLLLEVRLEPGWRWTGEAWLRSGMGVLRRGWEGIKRRLGRSAADSRTRLLADLTLALRALKTWMADQVRLDLLNYRENLLFRYFYPLLDHWLRTQEASLEDLLGSLLSDLEGVVTVLGQEEAERQVRQRRLTELVPVAQEIAGRLAWEAGRETASR